MVMNVTFEKHIYCLIGPWEIVAVILNYFSKIVSKRDFLSIYCEIALRWLPHEWQDLTNN